MCFPSVHHRLHQVVGTQPCTCKQGSGDVSLAGSRTVSDQKYRHAVTAKCRLAVHSAPSSRTDDAIDSGICCVHTISVALRRQSKFAAICGRRNADLPQSSISLDHYLTALPLITQHGLPACAHWLQLHSQQPMTLAFPPHPTALRSSLSAATNSPTRHHPPLTHLDTCSRTGHLRHRHPCTHNAHPARKQEDSRRRWRSSSCAVGEVRRESGTSWELLCRTRSRS